MKIKSAFRLTALVLALALTALSLGSCIIIDDGSGVNMEDYISKAELDAYLAGKLVGNVTVEGGDNYDVNITLDGSEKNLAAAAKALLSSVSVFCTFETEVEGAWGAPNTVKKLSTAGSGVIYKMDKENGDAYVITNYHVVYNKQSNDPQGIAKEILLLLYGKESGEYAIPATYIGGSMEYDLALLKVSGSRVLAESQAMAATLANSGDLSVLDTAIAIGNPEGGGISATVGHVNVDSEYIDMTGADGASAIQLRVIRTDAAVNSGNSGGGLFNDKGELIGIVNAKMATSSVDNIGYAIPSNVAKYISDNILHYHKTLNKDRVNVYKCLMGVTVTAAESYTEYDPESGRVFNRERVEIATVEDGAAATGYLAVGDRINSITVDGFKTEVDRIYKVVDSMLNARVGSTVTVNVTRNGQVIDVTVPIASSNVTIVK